MLFIYFPKLSVIYDRSFPEKHDAGDKIQEMLQEIIAIDIVNDYFHTDVRYRERFDEIAKGIAKYTDFSLFFCLEKNI